MNLGVSLCNNGDTLLAGTVVTVVAVTVVVTGHKLLGIVFFNLWLRLRIITTMDQHGTDL